MSSRRASLLVVLAAVCALTAVACLAPEYFGIRGFPLDSAWTHAVYARSLAETGTLAYNPGIHTSGDVSPLWVLVMALSYAITTGSSAFVVATKLLGFALHVLTVLVLLRTLRERDVVAAWPLVGCLLVAAHPDLVSASMSGVEVPLATLTAASLLLAATRRSAAAFGAVCAMAPLVRPELGALSFAFPLVSIAGRDRRRLLRLLVAALTGTGLSFGALFAWNHASGLPLHAGIFSAATLSPVALVHAEMVGFDRVLERFAVADSSILVLAGAGIALRIVLARRATPAALSRAAAALLGALALFAVSFSWVPPVDPGSFADQRAALAALPLLVVALPALLRHAFDDLLPGRSARAGALALLLLLVLSLVVSSRSRYEVLANDARNIDDVQVAIGKQLSSASPRDVVWAVEGGAIRYFGKAFVVDLTGGNSASLRSADSRTFLEQHRPRYIQVIPGWSSVQTDSARSLAVLPFAPFTRYTLTSFQPMQRRWIVVCDDASVSGRVTVGSRPFSFRCADPLLPRQGDGALALVTHHPPPAD
jgi:hypothetical protein